MNFVTKFLSSAALALALSNTAFANTYRIVDTEDLYTFDITLTTEADASSSAQLVTAISGTFNHVWSDSSDNFTIFGLNTWFGPPDNLFLASADSSKWFTKTGGLSFNVDWYNVSFTGSKFNAYYNGNGAMYSGEFTHAYLATTAVPEPEVYAMMLAGLGLVGFAARRQQKAAV